jgi:hypothetical protein
MTFLNPFLLVALAAAAIPLLLHLLNLRKLRVVEFSSLRFLKELQKTRIRKLKLKQLLLLALRICLVIFAVLAFARPALRGSIGLPGAHAATTAVILLDNSYSMSVKDEKGTRFKQAQQAALDIVDLLEESDEAYLVPMSDVKSAINAEPSRNKEALKNAINSMELGYRRADLDDALRMAASLLDRSENLNKELYIITDAQQANAAKPVDSLRIFTEATRAYLLPIGEEANLVGGNLGLDSIRLLSSVFEVNKPVEVRAWVRNYGASDIENATVSLYINKERLGQASVTVAAGGTETIDLTAAPKQPGFQGGHIEIEGDALDADNRRYFAFPVIDRMRVALAGSPESMNFLGVALEIAGSSLVVDRVVPSSLPAVDLSKVAAVVLADATISDASRLTQFVQEGGGLVIYGGPSFDRNSFNSGLGASLGIALGAPTGDANNRGTGLKFNAVDRDHPIFSGVFDPANPGNVVESPDVYQAVPSTGGETIIRLSNGQPFMSEYRRGRGKVIYIAVPPTRVWSDFPMKGIFVPIATRSVFYVGARGDAFPTTTVGDAITVPLPARQNLPEQVTITSPSGREEFVPVRKFPSGASLTYDKTSTPGIYTIRAGGEDVALFTADMGSGESDLTPMSEERLRSIIASKMVAPDNLAILDGDGGDFASAITESRFGLELWKYMLFLALACAFAEMMVGRGKNSK